MFTSSLKKLITLTLLATALTPALYGFDMQREYPYLSLLIHNANASTFKKKLDQLVASPTAKTAEFRDMLKTLAQDVDHILLNTQAMHGADVSGNIADNGYSQLKWGIGEVALAVAMYSFCPKQNDKNAKVYYGMLATGLGSSIIGFMTLKNSVTTYLLSRRYGKHIHTTLDSLEEIKKEIATHLNA